MVGHPKFKERDIVKFKLDDQEKIGIIYLQSLSEDNEVSIILILKLDKDFTGKKIIDQYLS